MLKITTNKKLKNEDDKNNEFFNITIGGKEIEE